MSLAVASHLTYSVLLGLAEGMDWNWKTAQALYLPITTTAYNPPLFHMYMRCKLRR